MKVAVFFGGKSCEHSISVITAVQTMQALKQRHEVIPVFIDNMTGSFWTGKNLDTLEAFKESAKVKKVRVVLAPGSDKLYTYKGKVLAKLDAALLCTHGFGGEDGCLQGLLTLCGIPYTGSNVLASAVGMDKIFMKKVFERDFLPVVPYVGFSKSEYKSDLYNVVEKIKQSLCFPMIVKPANLGSSIGISVAHDFPELFEAISVGFMWDTRVVVEKALTDFKEYNCAAVGANGDYVVSEVERPLSSQTFLTYSEKYGTKKGGGTITGGKGKVKSDVVANKEFPANIPAELADKIKSYTKRVLDAIGASGVARVDFLYADGHLFVNEINTIPGALSNYLFSKGSQTLSFADLLDKLLNLALKAQKERDGLIYKYESSFKV